MSSALVSPPLESGKIEVIRGGLAMLQDNDAGVEVWAREVAVPAYERFAADPSRGISLDQVRANIEIRLRGADTFSM